MAVDKYTVEIVDSDGNSSKLVLPGFALDSTQEKLIKSVQALGKLNPKMAKAYEDLLDATKEAAKSGNSATEKQTEELEKVLTVTSEKQVKALKTFREAFADRVGKDMRDTFVAGGNILTAAIKTVTVGLAAGAGLLYKTFMDTSDAFRTLAQSGLGSGGVTGTEAQDAVANLTRLGMSASEAASMLTSFGRASAVLGKANFSKFVAGIAGSTAFAAELGLTLSEAAEFAAEEIDMRQRAMAGRMRLDAFSEVSIKENIRLTQAMSTIFGRSMKDIQKAKQDFLTQNAQLATLMLRLPTSIGEKAVKEISDMLTIAGGFSADIEQFMTIVLNAGASAIPMADSVIQQIMSLGGVGTQFKGTINQLNAELMSGSVDARSTMIRLIDMLAAGGEESARLLSILEQSGDPVAGMMARAARDAKQGGEELRNALFGIGPALDPLIESGTRLRNTLSEVQGAFTTFALQALGGLATPLNEFMKALTATGITEEQEKAAKKEIEQFERSRKLNANASKEQIEAYKRDRQAILDRVYAHDENTSVIKVLNDALNDVGKTFLKVFFGDINPTAEDFGKKLRNDLIPWIRQTAEDLKQWLNALEGKNFGEKLKSLLVGIIKEGAKLVLQGIGAALWEVLTSPTAIATLLAGFTGLFALSIVKTAVASAIATGLTPAIVSLGASLTGLTASVATASRNIVAASVTGMGSLKGLLGFALRALPVVGAAGVMGKDAMDIAGGKDEANKGSNWGGIIGGALGGLAAGAATIYSGGVAAPAAAAIVGGGVVAGNLIGDWIGSWFDSPEGEEKAGTVAEQAIEGIDSTGMAAMAMDPQHIRNVSLALEDFNKISVDNIANGLSNLTPQLTNLFTNLESIKTAFVDRINNRLERLVTILTKFNIEGLKLPVTTENLVSLANQIASIPTEPITNLATAFSALTTALKDFSELTTSTFFSRMMDGFTGKQDETANIIKTLNEFADEVETTKLSDAAAAIQSFTAAIANVARPTDVERSSPTNQNQPAATSTTPTNPMNGAQQNLANDRLETTMRRIELILDRQTVILNTIKDNTDPAKQR